MRLELDRHDVSKVLDISTRIVEDELAGKRVFLAPESLGKRPRKAKTRPKLRHHAGAYASQREGPF